MTQTKPSFLQFQVDHMAMLIAPELYNVAYLVLRTVFGARKSDVLYEKRKEWVAGQGERSLTYAICVGDEAECPSDKIINKALIAFIQPTEPDSQSSHVRTMLKDHRAAAHWQHIALRHPVARRGLHGGGVHHGRQPLEYQCAGGRVRFTHQRVSPRACGRWQRVAVGAPERHAGRHPA